METVARVESVISQQTGICVDYNAGLQDFDWIDRIQLAVDLEEEFGLRVEDAEIEKRRSVKALAEYIESLSEVRA